MDETRAAGWSATKLNYIEITSRPDVDVQVLPFTAGVYPVPGEVFYCLRNG